MDEESSEEENFSSGRRGGVLSPEQRKAEMRRLWTQGRKQVSVGEQVSDANKAQDDVPSVSSSSSSSSSEREDV